MSNGQLNKLFKSSRTDKGIKEMTDALTKAGIAHRVDDCPNYPGEKAVYVKEEDYLRSFNVVHPSRNFDANGKPIVK